MKSTGLFATAIALLALLTACATPELQEQPSVEFAEQALYPVKFTGFLEAHARRDAQLADYRNVNIEPLGLESVDITQTTVSGTVRSDWMITPEREVNLQSAWEQAMTRAFSDYQQLSPEDAEERLHKADAEPVLRISADLIRVRPRRATSATTAASGTPVHGTGDAVDVSVEFRLYDEASGQLLVVVRDRRTIATIQWTRARGVDMVNLFNSWSALLATRIAGR